MQKLSKRILISGAIVLGIGGVGCLLFPWSSKKQIILKDNLTLEINSDITIFDLLANDNQVNVVNENDKVDTSSLGSHEITLKYLQGKKENTQTCTIEIIDTEAPTIDYPKEIVTKKGQTVDLLKDVQVNDNSKEEITATVIGDYDFNKVGTYSLKYQAQDSSHNQTEVDFVLKVEKVATSTQLNSETYFTTSKGFQGVVRNGVTYIDGTLIVNKTYSLPQTFGNGLTTETLNAFKKMQAAALLDGLNIYIASGFRSYDKQVVLYDKYVKRDGKVAADTYSARAGHSEHQSGLTFDVNEVSDAFIGTPVAIWLSNNASKYGFILRYPEGKEDVTGFKYESWHFRYVGIPLAEKLYNDGDWLTLEEYFGIDSVYAD